MKYNIIYADPPWTYRVWSDKGKQRTASSHYSTMELDEICELPVENIAADNCVLFLWVTSPNLQEAFKVIESWGFKYKTIAFVWVKIYMGGKPFTGLGYWTRANAEMCLLATKGDIKRINKNVSQIILALREEHSEKPDEARKRIVELIGDLPRIELFARGNRSPDLFGDNKFDGWDVWGDEVKSDVKL